MSAMAFMVFSEEVVLSNSAIIMVASSWKNMSRTRLGSMASGISMLSASSYQSTSLTWSTPSSCFSSAAVSFLFMPSTMIIENAPEPKSSTITSWP